MSDDTWSGRCRGFPRGKCRKTNAYAKAKTGSWLCKSCKEKRTKAQWKATDAWRERWR